FGLRMQMGQITALRENRDQQWEGGKKPQLPGENRHGDIIEQIEVTESNGKVTRYIFPGKKKPVHAVPRKFLKVDSREIDPARLRYELQEWAARNKSGDRTVTLKVRRQNDVNGAGEVPATLRIKWQDKDDTNNMDWKFAQEVPSAPTAPQPISELGF